eukprot:g2126.t1
MSERLVLLYTYVHGFGQTTDCVIGTELCKRLQPHGIHVEIIDAMNGLTRFDCSVSSGVAALEAIYKKRKKPFQLIGASMGGLISLIYTKKYPENVDRLILLNPVLNLESIWSSIIKMYHPKVPGEELMKKWKEEGQIMIKGIQMTNSETISYDYVVDSLTYPAFPLVDKPVLSLVGVQDFVIPLSYHQEWKKRQRDPEKVTIIEFDDGHFVQAEKAWETIVSVIVKYSK